MWELELMMLVNVRLLLKVNVFVGTAFWLLSGRLNVTFTGGEQFSSGKVGLKLYFTVSILRSWYTAS